MIIINNDIRYCKQNSNAYLPTVVKTHAHLVIFSEGVTLKSHECNSLEATENLPKFLSISHYEVLSFFNN